MKIYTKIVLILLASFTLVFAEISVDAQIQEIQNAKPSERPQMMNALKIRLSNMNARDRSEAISQLRTQMRTQNHAEQQTYTQSHEADSMQQMQGMQIMNQKQAGQHMMDSVGDTHQVPMTDTDNTGTNMPFGHREEK